MTSGSKDMRIKHRISYSIGNNMSQPIGILIISLNGGFLCNKKNNARQASHTSLQIYGLKKNWYVSMIILIQIYNQWI